MFCKTFPEKNYNWSLFRSKSLVINSINFTYTSLFITLLTKFWEYMVFKIYSFPPNFQTYINFLYSIIFKQYTLHSDIYRPFLIFIGGVYVCVSLLTQLNMWHLGLIHIKVQVSPPAFASSDCWNKLALTWWIKQQKIILLLFWRPEAWNQSLSSPEPPPRAPLKNPPPLPAPVSGGPRGLPVWPHCLLLFCLLTSSPSFFQG